MDAFSPHNDTKAFRNALGRFATGVTIVSAHSQNGPISITANSFSSISLSPPLIMWAPAKQSSRHDAFIDSEYFAIHILSDQQKKVCDTFAKPQSDFSTQPHTLNDKGIPLYKNCLAVFECSRQNVHDAGDHSIIIGHVDRVSSQDGNPLIFSQGKFYKNPVSLK